MHHTVNDAACADKILLSLDLKKYMVHQHGQVLKEKIQNPQVEY